MPPAGDLLLVDVVTATDAPQKMRVFSLSLQPFLLALIPDALATTTVGSARSTAR